MSFKEFEKNSKKFFEYDLRNFGGILILRGGKESWEEEEEEWGRGMDKNFEFDRIWVRSYKNNEEKRVKHSDFIQNLTGG